MAEETTKQDFTKFHSLPVEEWRSYGGSDYIKYLHKSKVNKDIQLTHEEKRDLDRLEEYERGSPGKEEEQDYDYDINKINWHEIDQPNKVAFYVLMSKFMVSNENGNRDLYNYVQKHWKTKGGVGIAKDAKKELARIERLMQNNQDENAETNQESNETEEKPAQKPTLLMRIIRFARKSNEKLDGKNAVFNSRQAEEIENKKREETKKEVSEVEGLLEENERKEQ